MSWEIFRAEYKQGLENNDDMAKVIAESYDKCVKIGMSGAGTAPPAPLVAGNVSGLQTMLKAKPHWVKGITAPAIVGDHVTTKND